MLQSQTQKLSVLVVEDDAAVRKLMTRLLGPDMEVFCADSIASALAAVEQDHFDILVSDIALRDGSGLDLMRKIKNEHQHIRGIALTGYAHPDDVVRCIEAGFDLHLAKPAAPEVIVRTIRNLGMN